MARKRKIPARHHHGVRDPLKQQEQREKKLKNIINNPPEKDGEKISRKFMQFKKLADAAKTGKKLPKRLRAGREDLIKKVEIKKGVQGNTKLPVTTNKIKYVKQLPGECDEAYLKRINRITSQSLREAQYEAKYGVRITRNKKSGEILVQKKPKNEIDELLKLREKQRLVSKRGKSSKHKKYDLGKERIDAKTAKELIKETLKEEKAEKRGIQLQEYEKDYIPFGEVVHAPPIINTIPRKAEKADTVPRPGKRSLLLTSLFNDSIKSRVDNNSSNKKRGTQLQNVTKAHLKGKRKELPAGIRDMLEKERDKFVELYRNLKKPTPNN